MKALEMLYRDKKWIEEECDISKIPIERVQTMIKDLVEINEAIAELEALQQRSCESCVHRSFLDETLTNKVTNGFCIENGFFTKVGFCCSRYEGGKIESAERLIGNYDVWFNCMERSK